ncbi:MAG: hypothetical protein C0524_00630 [Rhodobacter sp.]|nr:hypothetical protein [Rhodobacter sp.]
MTLWLDSRLSDDAIATRGFALKPAPLTMIRQLLRLSPRTDDSAFCDLLNQQGVTTIVTCWGMQKGVRPSPGLRQAEIRLLDRNLSNNVMLEARAKDTAGGFSYAVQTLGVAEQDAYALWDEMIARAPKPVSGNTICSGTFEGCKIAAIFRPGSSVGG